MPIPKRRSNVASKGGNMQWLARGSLVPLAALACLAWPPPAVSGDPVDLELVLAVDVSPSVDDFEAKQQRDGYLAALTHPSIISAIESGLLGRIAVTYVEWAGEDYQRTVVDWAAIHDAASARAFADRLAARPIAGAPYTSISGVIDFARRAFDENGFDGTRRVIDISGDGPNSAGRRVEPARDQAVAAGITINGLPVFNDRPNPEGAGLAVDLDSYYELKVIGGAGSFSMIADFDVFAPTILRKLVREIAEPRPGAGRRFAETAP
jgi:hypothetical protein